MKAEKVPFGLRLDRDVLAWIRRASAKKRITASQFVRQHLLAAYEQRHAKYFPKEDVGEEGAQ